MSIFLYASYVLRHVVCSCAYFQKLLLIGFAIYNSLSLLIHDINIGDQQGIAIALKCGATKAQFDSTVSSQLS